MPVTLTRRYRLLLKFSLFSRSLFNLPFVVINFVFGSAGKEYGIGKMAKLKLAVKFIRNKLKIRSFTTLIDHFLLTEEIFRIPKSLKGDVVECGCYNGGSTSALSLACALTKRRLFVCDSFEGLPEPRSDERLVKRSLYGLKKYVIYWEKGELASEGGINKVKENIRKYGNIKACNFIKGHFKDTLKNIKTDSIVLIFEDADLLSSVRDCLKFLWPKLLEGCKFYCHEPWSEGVMSLFSDKKWWKKELNTSAPGFCGEKHGIKYGIMKIGSTGFAEK
jgi:hypothetical protein